MSSTTSLFTLSSTATYEIDCPFPASEDPYFTVQIDASDDDLGETLPNHKDGICLFMRPDQVAELFYALRDADAKWLDVCSVCDGSGKAPGDEPGMTVPCKACRASGAVLKAREAVAP